ncbi:MAG: translocation/assembly module TamB domain-containing protein [Acidobacteriota bacterium]
MSVEGHAPRSADDAPGGPGFCRRWLVRPLGWTLAVLAVALVVVVSMLDSRWARDAARQEIVEGLETAFDREVSLRDVRFRLLPMRLVLLDLEIAGPEPGDRSFLRVPRTEIEGDLAALRDRRLRLHQVRLERPEIYLRFWPEGSNLLQPRRVMDRAASSDPAQPRKQRRLPRKPFDLRIDQLSIDRALLALDQDGIELSFDADALRARFHSFDSRTGLSGSASARDVELRLPGARPLPLTVAADGTFTADGVTVDAIDWSGRHTRGSASGRCRWTGGAERFCTFDVAGRIDGEGLAALGWFRSLRGAVEVDGIYRWRPSAFGWRGQVAGERLELWDRKLTNLRGELSADRFSTRLDLERADYADGTLSGRVEIETDVAERPLSVDLDVANIRLADLLADQRIPVGELASRASGSVTYRCPVRECRRGDGAADVSLEADPTQPGLALGGTVPLMIRAGSVATTSATAASESHGLLASGTWHLPTGTGSYDWRIETTAVEELVPLLPVEIDPWPFWAPSAGSGRLEGQLDIADGQMEVATRLQLENVVTERLSAERVAGSLSVDADRVDALQLDLGDRDQALVVRGAVPLAGRDGQVDLAIDAFRWPSSQLERWVDLPLAIAGPATGRLELSYPVASDEAGALATQPAGAPETTLAGRLSIRLEPARLGKAPFGSATADLAWQDGVMEVSDIALREGSGRVVGKGRIDLTTGALDLAATTDGVALGELGGLLGPAAGALASLPGRLAGEASVGGTWERPDVRVEGRVRRADEGRGRTNDSQFVVTWAEHRLAVAGRLLDAIAINGGGRLGREGSDVRLELETADLHRLGDALDLELPTALEGALRGTLELRGERGTTPSVDLRLGASELRFGDRRLLAQPGSHLAMTADGWTIEALRFADPDGFGRLLATGGGAWEEEVKLALQAQLEADWLRLALPSPLDAGAGAGIDGRIRFDGAVRGTVGRPALRGTATLDGVGFALPEPLGAIDDLRGELRFEGREVQVEDVTAAVAGGRLELSGRGRLPATSDEAPSYSLRAETRGLEFDDVAGWRLLGDADLVLRSDDGGHAISGRAELDRLTYTEDLRFDLASLLRRMVGGGRLDAGQADSALAAIRLDVQLDGEGALAVRNNVARLEGDADLFLRGTAAAPALIGEVTVEPGGALEYNGTDYTVERGRLLFTDPYRLSPEIDVVATTRVRDYDVTLALAGRPERLETQFSSDPPLPDVEVVRLLAGGESYIEPSGTIERTVERRDEDDGTSAATFLYGQAASLIGDRVNNLFGFDKFRIDPLTGSDRDNLSTARVTVGKRLRQDLFLTYSVDPSSTEGQRLQIEWRLSDDLTLVLTQNGDDTYSADARWEATF